MVPGRCWFHGLAGLGDVPFEPVPFALSSGRRALRCSGLAMTAYFPRLPGWQGHLTRWAGYASSI